MHTFSDPLVQNTADFYVLAIGTGEPAAAMEQYVGDRYVQHNLSVADGIEGFIENFKGFIERIPDRDVRVIRGFRDGNKVFIHVLQDLGKSGLWVTMDIFDTEGGRIVEHWDNIQKAENHGVAQQMIGGPVKVEAPDQTEPNKQIAQEFLAGLLENDAEKAASKVNEANFSHHSGAKGGDWTSRKQALFGSGQIRYHKLHQLLGSGNFVATLAEGTIEGEPAAFMDLFRLKNGAIVENWNVPELIPPKEKWAHENGKF